MSPNNHVVRTKDWSCIRYADGSEELYDRYKDPDEWINLVGKPELKDAIEERTAMLPKVNANPATGNSHRLLVRKNDAWYWEGREIVPQAVQK